jgi:hypothetical protein
MASKLASCAAALPNHSPGTMSNMVGHMIAGPINRSYQPEFSYIEGASGLAVTYKKEGRYRLKLELSTRAETSEPLFARPANRLTWTPCAVC